VVDLAEDLRRHERLGLGLPEHEAELALAEDRHHRVEDNAELEAADGEDDVFPGVRQLAAEDVVLLQPEALEAGGDPSGERVELGPGEIVAGAVRDTNVVSARASGRAAATASK
jgi:hypothetical protein